MDPNEVIMTRSLSKWVMSGGNRLDILTGVNLSINRGESIAILGRSGSGKSTLLSLLAGMDSPSSGEIYLENQALHQMDEDQRADMRRQRISFLFQSFLLLEHLTAIENVMLPLELSGTPEADRLAADALAQMNLGGRHHHYPRQLSGGEQQRVALARAFICRSPVIFADEPTGNLDLKTGTHVMDTLFEQHQREGSTLILVTHDRELAARCERSFRLEEGILEPLS